MRCVVCDTSRYYGTGVFSHRWLIIRTVGRWKAWKAIEADRAISRSLSFPMHEYNIFVTLATIIEIQFPRHFYILCCLCLNTIFFFPIQQIVWPCRIFKSFQVGDFSNQIDDYGKKLMLCYGIFPSFHSLSLSVSQLLVFRSVSIRNWAERKSLRLCGFLMTSIDFNRLSWYAFNFYFYKKKPNSHHFYATAFVFFVHKMLQCKQWTTCSSYKSKSIFNPEVINEKTNITKPHSIITMLHFVD